MKLAITVLVLVGAFFLSGWGGMVAASMERMHSANTEEHSVESVIGDVQAAFDPTWVENLKNADLITSLKGMSGLSGE